MTKTDREKALEKSIMDTLNDPTFKKEMHKNFKEIDIAQVACGSKANVSW